MRSYLRALIVLAALFVGVEIAAGAQLRKVMSGTVTIPTAVGTVRCGLATGTCVKVNGSGSVATWSQYNNSALLDQNKAFIVHSQKFSSNDPTMQMMTAKIESTTSILFERSFSSGAMDLAWYVAEFTSGVGVEHGTVNFSGTSTTATVALATVASTAHSFPLVSKMNATGDWTSDQTFVKATLTSASTLTFAAVGTVHAGSDVAYQVVRYTSGASVASGTVSLAAASSAANGSHSCAASAHCWLVYSYSLDNAAGADDYHIRGFLNSGTQVRFDRYASTGAPAASVQYYLVTFSDGTVVRRAEQTFTSGEVTAFPKTVAIAGTGRTQAIVPGGAWGLFSGKFANSTATNSNPNKYDLTSATTLDVYWSRGTANMATWYQVIQFPVSATAVRLEELRAANRPDGVHVLWRTGMEVDNLGFHVWRERDGKRTRLDTTMIAGSALLSSSGQGFSGGHGYGFVDPEGRSTDRYWLESLDLSGTSEMHGPVQPHQGRHQGAAVVSQALTTLGTDQSPYTTTVWPDEVVKPLRPVVRDPRTGFKLAAGAAAKVHVTEDGWQRVRLGDLPAGVLGERPDPRRLQVYFEGQEQAIRVIGEEDGRVDADDVVEFYGRPLARPSTTTAVYWLVAGDRPGRRVSTLTPAALAPEARFHMAVARWQARSKLYAAAIKNGADANFYEAVVGREPARLEIPVHQLVTDGPAAELELTLQGLNAAVHTVTVERDGVLLGTASFTGQDRVTRTFSLPASSLAEGANAFLVKSSGESDVSLIEVARLRYPRSFHIEGAAQAFSVPPSTPVKLRGPGLRGLRVYDVSKPGQPFELQAVTDADGVAVVTPEGGGVRALLAVTAEGAISPRVTANQPSTYQRGREAADFLIVGPGHLLPAAQPLVEARRRQGWRPALIDVEDVYDEQSFGIKDPDAIRVFLRAALRTWSVAPRAVLLVGDGSFDPRNLTGRDVPDLMPVPLVEALSLETASDDWFVDFDDDGVGEIAIGRLPVRTYNETAELVAKLVAHLPAARNDESLLTLIAGRDEERRFDHATTELQGRLGTGLRTTRITADVLPPGTPQARVAEAFASGPAILSYMGHGSVEVWADGLMSSAGAGSLSPTRPPVVLAMTCLNAFFQDVFTTSLGESLVRAPKGAVSVISSSGLTQSVEQTPLQAELLRLLVDEQLPLGEALRRAKAVTENLDVRRTFVLLGDPTLQVVQPQRAQVSVGTSGCQMGASGVGSVALWLVPLLALLLRRRRQG